jgi:hypothetical protein
MRRALQAGRGLHGITFNSGDTEGQHACTIFGGRPEARESLGWIA